MDHQQEKRVKAEGDDRISALPDHLLCQILSLLPTKDAAATSVLSTRWKDLFASVPIIDCSIQSKGSAGTASFVPFVYRLLYLIGSRSPHVHKFRMSIHSKALGNLIISSWISTAVSFNVQELILQLENTNSLKLPLPLFSCKSLTVLDLQGKFLLSVPPNVSLPSLKTLSLTRYVMLYDDDNVRRLLSGCPVLEDLMFNFCYLENIKVFDMSYPSMKRLAIHGHGDYELSLNAPNLERLDILCYSDIRCSGDAFESLPEFSIDLGSSLPRDVSQAKIPEIVNKACYAPKLFLLGSTLEILGYAPHLMPSFHSLTYLFLDVNRIEAWKSLPLMLESSPCLETLIIKGFRGKHVQFPLPRVPICFSLHLKTIELKYFRGAEDEFTLLAYILANAMVLENVKISDMDPNPDIFRMTRERLLAFPTYSQTYKITLAPYIPSFSSRVV